jgi:hypothetical protein
MAANISGFTVLFSASGNFFVADYRPYSLPAWTVNKYTCFLPLQPLLGYIVFMVSGVLVKIFIKAKCTLATLFLFWPCTPFTKVRGFHWRFWKRVCFTTQDLFLQTLHFHFHFHFSGMGWVYKQWRSGNGCDPSTRKRLYKNLRGLDDCARKKKFVVENNL